MVLFQVHLVDKGKREKKDTLDPKEKKVHLNMFLLALGTLRDQTNESINPASPPLGHRLPCLSFTGILLKSVNIHVTTQEVRYD